MNSNHITRTLNILLPHLELLRCAPAAYAKMRSEKVNPVTSWCKANNRLRKTKEMTVDYRKLQGGGHAPIHVKGAAVETVRCFKFLGISHVYYPKGSKTAPLPLPESEEVQRGQQDTLKHLQMHHRGYPGWGTLPPGTVGVLQRVVKSAQHIPRPELPAIQDIQDPL